MKTRIFGLIGAVLFAAAALLGAAPGSSASNRGDVGPNISITTLPTTITQDFNTLISSGSVTWTNNSTLTGWYHARTGTGTTLVADNGGSNTGNFYSYGTGTNIERALGSVGSGGAAAGHFFWGILLTNNTGATINTLDVSYTGEQWRNSAAAAHTVSFSFLVGTGLTGNLAEFQSTGTPVASLNFTSPITGGAAAALDGNLAANRLVMTFSITGLSVAPGQDIMLRWSDLDHTGADHGLAIDDFSVTASTTGGPTPTPSPTTTPTPSATPAPTRVRDIQGATHSSPLNGQVVAGVPGVVTATVSNGFFLQDPSPDSNDATSEGIFVFTTSAPTVNVGDSVLVGGTVVEFRPGGSSSTNLTTTEISSPGIAVQSTGNPLPAPVVIGTGGRIPPTTVIDDDATGSVETSGTFDHTTDGIDFYESLEGMRVQMNAAVAVGPRTDFGEIPVLSDDGANAVVRTTRGGIVVRSADFNPERVFLDDTILATPVVNVGDHFSAPAVGVMDYNFGNFKLLITQALTAVSGGLARETTAIPTSTQLAIATFNVENLDPGDPPAQFTALASLIVNNLRSPDIITLEEVQDNNGPTNDAVVDATTTYNTLISAIQAAGGPTYLFRQINPVDDQDGGEPGGNIRVGFLFRTDRGLAFIDRPGGCSTCATTVGSGPSGTELSFSPGRVDPANSAFNNSRKPLAGEFTFNAQKLFLIANHFNSKGGDHPLFGRFQPPVLSSETQRNQQAQIVNNFVDSILALDSSAKIVVLGDLNDFHFSTPINTLKGGVLNALIETLPESERYTYVFEGNSQDLDHILVSNSLFSGLFDYDVVHVNSEFVDQISDHDPQVVRLTLGASPTPTATPSPTATVTPSPPPISTPTTTPTPATPPPTPTVTPPPTPTATPTPSATPCFLSEMEPNNTIGAPQILFTSTRVELFGSINPVGDVDFYRFDTNAGDRIWAYVFTNGATSSTDSQLSLFNGAFTLLQFDDDDGNQAPFSSGIAGAPIDSPTSCALKVNPFSASATIVPYTLFLDRTSGAATPESEPNETIGTANAYVIGSVATGSVTTTGDLDTFSFTASAGDRLVIQVDGNPERDATDFNPNFRVLDSAGAVLLTVDSDDTFCGAGCPGASFVFRSENHLFTVPATGTYGVQVISDATGPTTGNYALHIWRPLGPPCATPIPTPSPTPSNAPPSATPPPTVSPTPTATATATATATGTVPPTPTIAPSNAPPSPTPSVTPNPCAGMEFMNSTFIGIPATGTGATTGAPANPYPSNIAVAGLSGTVTKVRVRLGVNHTFPDDLDVLLVGPGGQTALLMSDVGGDADTMSTVFLELDDAAATSMPDGNTLVSGTFKPTNIGGSDAFPAPAPAPGANTLLSIFNGTAPNGTWALYVVDDKESDVGSFSAGWSLTITTVAGCGTPFPTPTATPVSPTPTPSASPSASPTPVSKAINLSTRMLVQTGDNVGIGGFIISGSVPKDVIVRAIGPSLTQFDVPNALADPMLELHGPSGFATVTNNNWRDTQEQEIQDTGIPPTNDLESAIVATLDPGAYTAIVRGNGNTTGVALVEVYDLNQGVDSKLANLATRAFVSTGDNIVIAGFLLSDSGGINGLGGPGDDRVIVRGIGPSLAPAIFPVSAVLANPTLELRDNNGTLILANNDWQDNADQAAAIIAASLAPTNDLESAIAATLPPGLYTGLLSGLSNGTGIGVVEIYDLGP